MGRFSSANHHLRFFDELALKQTFIHRLHPLTKLLTTLLFLVAVVSFSKYSISALLPLFMYPIALLIMADLPVGLLFQRMLVAIPFALGVGIFNPLLDQTPLIWVGEMGIGAGWISFSSLMLRFALTVMAGLILIATTGIHGLSTALGRLGLGRPFVNQLLFVYRYMSVLGEEVFRALRAHALRSLKDGGVPYRVWGSFLGLLLLRTMSRAERLHHAMICRGFTGRIPRMQQTVMGWGDVMYLGVWILYFTVVRWINLPQWFGRIMMGVFV